MGKDLMIGGPGGDQFVGNPGIDTVSYKGVPKPVKVLVGGGFGSGSVFDGPAGSRDQVTGSVENVIGGTSFNKLVGSSGANVLIGGPKQDRLRGEGDNDRLFGRKGRDYVVGGDGGDRVVGGKGQDKMGGGNGIDSLFARDGRAEFSVNRAAGEPGVRQVRPGARPPDQLLSGDRYRGLPAPRGRGARSGL